MASKVLIPMSFFLQEKLRAFAVDSPTRRPVKDPGPMVVAMRSRSLNFKFAFFMRRLIMGMSSSAWPRSISFVSLKACLFLRTQTEQAAIEVSIARMFIFEYT